MSGMFLWAIEFFWQFPQNLFILGWIADFFWKISMLAILKTFRLEPFRVNLNSVCVEFML